MKKMYYAKKVVDVVIVLEESKTTDYHSFNGEVNHFLEEEGRNHVPKRLEIKEVKSLDDLPKDWWEATYWGDNENDQCPADYLQDSEYKEYLRLKKQGFNVI